MVKAYLKEKYSKAGNVYLGIPHRLDRPVSGVVLFARNSKAAKRLAEQFRHHQVRGLLGGGRWEGLPAEGIWEDWLLPTWARRRGLEVVGADDDPLARDAMLSYARPGRRAGGWTLLEIGPRTGRMPWGRDAGCVTRLAGAAATRRSTAPVNRSGPTADLRDRVIALHATQPHVPAPHSVRAGDGRRAAVGDLAGIHRVSRPINCVLSGLAGIVIPALKMTGVWPVRHLIRTERARHDYATVCLGIRGKRPDAHRPGGSYAGAEGAIPGQGSGGHPQGQRGLQRGACVPDPKEKDHVMVLFALDGTAEIRAGRWTRS